ncbi:MAG: flavodoxin [Clostridia bacterium]|nr:flavodoxin [Clostridia bacterium]
MKRRTSPILILLAVLTLAGCGNQEPARNEAEATSEAKATNEAKATSEAEATNEEEAANDEDQPVELETGSDTGNTLIAYFTWADNTYVENSEEVDVDATTSASVLQPGNVGLIASWIQEETGADLFSIQVEDLYSSDYDECLDRASEENAQDARPALATHVENMDQYDTIYLGYPNWWYATPMAVLSFIDEYNFEGKQIILFCSHGTGGLAGSVDAITEELPENCSISDNVLGVYRLDVADSKDRVLNWLEEVQA